MEFAVVECADRSFEDLCAQLCQEPAVALRAAAGSLATELEAEADRLMVAGPETAVVHTAWRDPDGRVWLEAELRVLSINRGAEPVTELLMIGHSSASGPGRSGVLAFAHRVLAELADHPRCAVGSRPPGSGRSR